jgi:hypothetical protein
VTHTALVDDDKRYRYQVNRYMVQVMEEEQAALDRIEAGARAVLGTVDSLCSFRMANDKAFVVIIDEAGTVPEYKMPLLINMGAAAIVAIGDQKQLKPFTHAKDDDDRMDGFFQRAVGAIGNVPMLSIQYRMHPDIAGIVSDLFYDGRLTTHPGVAKKRQHLPDPALQWIDYQSHDAKSQTTPRVRRRQESDDPKNRCNTREVEEISRFMHNQLKDLLDKGKTVCIITFYRHQLTLLMNEAVAAGFARTERQMKALNAEKKDAQSDQEQARSATRFKHPNFRIVTVDAAQGSEADIVVISCVRCNPRRGIGFVKNLNRACVALSRAKECLLIVGSVDTMSSDRVWKRVHEEAQLALTLSYGAAGAQDQAKEVGAARRRRGAKRLHRGAGAQDQAKEVGAAGAQDQAMEVGAAVVVADEGTEMEHLKKENSEQKQLLEQQTMLIDCVVCMAMPKNILLLPCTHLCICSACSANLMGQEPQLCPICRQPVKEAKEVKIS